MNGCAPSVSRRRDVVSSDGTAIPARRAAFRPARSPGRPRNSCLKKFSQLYARHLLWPMFSELPATSTARLAEGGGWTQGLCHPYPTKRGHHCICLCYCPAAACPHNNPCRCDQAGAQKGSRPAPERGSRSRKVRVHLQIADAAPHTSDPADLPISTPPPRTSPLPGLC